MSILDFLSNYSPDPALAARVAARGFAADLATATGEVALSTGPVLEAA